MISFVEEDISFKFRKSDLKKYIKDIILSESKNQGEISVVLCSDEHLLKINKEYLKHDFYTDIITFDYCVNSLISGDLMISVDRIKENALLHKVSALEEFHRVVFHGVLHLCGYGDKSPSDKLLMTSKEDFYLKKHLV